jgi:hypothetical protein
MNFETFGYVSCRGGQALAETTFVCEEAVYQDDFARREGALAYVNLNQPSKQRRLDP